MIYMHEFIEKPKSVYEFINDSRKSELLVYIDWRKACLEEPLRIKHLL